MLKTVLRISALLACAMTFVPAAIAADKPAIDTGDTAWLLVATALVLMMNIPGLALFYAGMVRKKNVLATAVQAFAVAALVTVLWFIVGYSLAFTAAATSTPSSVAVARLRPGTAGQRATSSPGRCRKTSS